MREALEASVQELLEDPKAPPQQHTYGEKQKQ